VFGSVPLCFFDPRSKPFNAEVLRAFCQFFVFQDMTIDEALRYSPSSTNMLRICWRTLRFDPFQDVLVEVPAARRGTED
jgi:hypothetical protein